METNLNGIRLHYEDVGDGPTLLLLHAFPLSGAMWREQVAWLRGAYRLIVPDLRGFGDSDAPPGPATMEQQADDMAALLEQLHVARAVVVGLSMGGYIAFAFWRRHADKVVALVLADTKAGADSEEGRAGREANARIAEEQGADAIAEKMIPTLVSAGAPQTLHDELRAMIGANSPDGIAAALRGMALRPDSTPDLAGITVPTLLIVGEADALTPPAEATKINMGVVGRPTSVALLPDVGHLSAMEAPEAFSSALAEFLGQLERW